MHSVKIGVGLIGALSLSSVWIAGCAEGGTSLSSTGSTSGPGDGGSGAQGGSGGGPSSGSGGSDTGGSGGSSSGGGSGGSGGSSSGGGSGGSGGSSSGGGGSGGSSSGGGGGVCTPASTRPCYAGPTGTEGVGVCRGGEQSCNAEGTGFGACAGEVLPVPESCATPGDDNCDGVVNEGCGPCTTDRIVNGNFELGSGSSWLEDTATGSPILCDLGDCGDGEGTGPRGGSTYWAWFGGVSDDFEEGTLSQSVTLTRGTAVLHFYLEIPACDNDEDYLEVRVDGTQVFMVFGDDLACEDIGYVEKTVDLGTYADGAAHTVEFHTETFAWNFGVTNFFVDDVSLLNCP